MVLVAWLSGDADGLSAGHARDIRIAEVFKRILQRSHARKPESRRSVIDSAKLLGQCGNGVPMTTRLTGDSGDGNGVATQRECHVEGRRGRAGGVDDVGADSQPI